MSLLPQYNTTLSLVERHWGSGYEQTLILCIQTEFTQHRKTKIQLCCSKPDSLVILLMQPVCCFLFFFKYIFLRSLPVKSQNCIILMAEQLQPVMIISALSSKASDYFLQAQVQVLLAVSVAQAICIPGETDQWANQLVNGQVCLAAFMQQQQRLCCLHYYSWPTLSKKKRKEGWEGGKQGKLKQIWG